MKSTDLLQLVDNLQQVCGVSRIVWVKSCMICDVGTLMNIRYKSTLRDKNKAREKGGLLGNKGARKKWTRRE